MAQRAGATLRVVTWNVLHAFDLRRGAVDLEAVTHTIAGLDADVVALQEVDRGLERSGGVDQAGTIAERLGLHVTFAPSLSGDPSAAWRAIRGADRGGAGYGIALLSRHPLADVRCFRLPGGGDGRRTPRPPGTNPGWDREPRVGLQASLAIGGRMVVVATTHLSYLPWRGLRQLVCLTRSIGTTAPAVLTGDFNLPPWAVAPATPGWRGAGGMPTYPASAPRIQLDQVLVRGLDVAGVTVVDASTSDHRAVVADLLIP